MATTPSFLEECTDTAFCSEERELMLAWTAWRHHRVHA